MFKKMIENEIWRQACLGARLRLPPWPQQPCGVHQIVCVSFCLQRLALQWNMMEHAYPAGSRR